MSTEAHDAAIAEQSSPATAVAATGHDAASIKAHVRGYLIVFWWLLILTVVTVAISTLDLRVNRAVLIALAIAGTKGSLVGGVFMHQFAERNRILFGLLTFTGVFFLALIGLTTFGFGTSFGAAAHVASAAVGGGGHGAEAVPAASATETQSAPATTVTPSRRAATVPTEFSATISGTVTFAGDAPTMRLVAMDADPVCAALNAQGDPVRAQTLVLGAEQRMADVIVRIVSNVPPIDYAPPSEPIEFNQAGCHYTPHVLVAHVGQEVQILNPDGTLHNVHVFAAVNPEFNEAMPQFRTQISKTFDRVEEEPFQIKCDVHPWMGAWAMVLDHPFFDVTGTDGTFVIDELPPGDYTVEIWHPRLGTQSVDVTVGSNETTTVDFAMSVPT